MLRWVVLVAVVALVFGLFLAAFRKRYRGDRGAEVGGVVASVGGTLGIALPLAQLNGVTFAMWQVLAGGLLSVVCALGGVLYSQTRQARTRRVTDTR